MRRSFKGRIKIQKAKLEESSKHLSNPGCGWYHIYYFSVEESMEESLVQTSEESMVLYEGEELVLALFDIGYFRSCEISSNALSYIGHILDFFRQKQKQVILRFAYDLTGQGMEKEPSSVQLIKKHMEQLQPIIIRNADNILVLQGIFVGNWGEMHGSKFLTERFLTELAKTLLRLTEGKCCLAVRTPAQWRTIMRREEKKGIFEGRLALFNDGIFGSPTDMGTYGEADRQEGGDSEKWSREEELAWQEKHLDSVPNGGEVLLGDYPISYSQAVKDLKRMHLTYLNSAYHQEQLDFWKQETVKMEGCWEGVSGYDYIGRHLGYRFVVRDIKAHLGNRLEITVENCGFASLWEKTNCFLVIEERDGQTYRIQLDADAREWKSGKRMILQAMIPHPEKIKGPGRLLLELKRKRDNMTIHFANQDAEEGILLGRF